MDFEDMDEEAEEEDTEEVKENYDYALKLKSIHLRYRSISPFSSLLQKTKTKQASPLLKYHLLNVLALFISV
jgi:hypothetical protein